jgi:hypothetical protein
MNRANFFVTDDLQLSFNFKSVKIMERLVVKGGDSVQPRLSLPLSALSWFIADNLNDRCNHGKEVTRRDSRGANSG